MPDYAAPQPERAEVPGGKAPPSDGRGLLRVFGRAGWTVAREGAEHTILTHPKSPMTLAIPRHRGDLKDGTVRSLIRKAGLTEDEFLKLR